MTEKQSRWCGGKEKHCSSFSGLALNTSVQWETMNSCISQKSVRVVLDQALISNGLSDQAAVCSQLFEQWTSCKGCINQHSVAWIHACEQTCEHLQVYCGGLSLDLIRGVVRARTENEGSGHCWPEQDALQCCSGALLAVLDINWLLLLV